MPGLKKQLRMEIEKWRDNQKINVEYFSLISILSKSRHSQKGEYSKMLSNI
jgi:plasmid rolling circle replication initiator protein Rep